MLLYKTEDCAAPGGRKLLRREGNASREVIVNHNEVGEIRSYPGQR